MLKIFTVIALFLTFRCHASTESIYVQGPFNIVQGSRVYIKEENDANRPLGLYFEKKGHAIKIDSYDVNGGSPNIETVFFVTLGGVKHVVVLVSWHVMHRAERISGTSYQVYGYSLHDDGMVNNKEISDDPELCGEEGEFSGESLYFKYKKRAFIILCHVKKSLQRYYFIEVAFKINCQLGQCQIPALDRHCPFFLRIH